jgi:TonB family protein
MQRFAKSRVMRLARAASGVVSLLISSASLAQIPAQPPQSKSGGEQVPIEVFEGARPNLKNFRSPGYPPGERSESNEGWVALCLMVGTDGKPYEPAVMRSSGSKAFDKAALKAVESLAFEPATLNGHPVDSAYEIKFQYTMTTPASGARPEFVRAYHSLMQAINANDKTAADTALEKLKVNNLYEDAYFGLATYAYAVSWGDETQQLASLERAIANEERGHYLPKDRFMLALKAQLTLRLRTRDYGGALITWNRLKRSGIDAETAAKFKPFIDQLETLRTDDTKYSVAGKLADGTWYLTLFKSHFQVAVSDGHLSEVKLRCEKRFVFFAFDPEIQYQVPSQYGKCVIELVGEPGTSFNLIQS